MTAFLKIYPIPKIRNIPIYRLAYCIAIYRIATLYRDTYRIARFLQIQSPSWWGLDFPTTSPWIWETIVKSIPDGGGQSTSNTVLGSILTWTLNYTIISWFYKWFYKWMNLSFCFSSMFPSTYFYAHFGLSHKKNAGWKRQNAHNFCNVFISALLFSSWPAGVILLEPFMSCSLQKYRWRLYYEL